MDRIQQRQRHIQEGGPGVSHGLVGVVQAAQGAAAAHLLDTAVARHGQLPNKLASRQRPQLQHSGHIAHVRNHQRVALENTRSTSAIIHQH